MIDLDIRLRVGDRHRAFDLAAHIRSDASFVAFYGPSGSGKSLTLQTMAGLLRPQAGHIRLGGRTLTDVASGRFVPPRERRLGYLFQDYALFPHLSVRENIGFGLTSWLRRRPSAAQRDRIDELLVRFGLAGLAASRPSTLSGGQKQRVALARALATQPDALLLDEPFSALNPMLRASMRAELKQVQAQWGIPVIMITHDIEDVLALAQTTFVFSDGQVVRDIDMATAHSRELLPGAPAPLSPQETARRDRFAGLLHTS
ncbi:MAG: Sulfate/thiosulfate import ATP-binding protein CysA [Paracidovorax wautersii]|uniref:Sulfate/thiosulfate import ATP-binding protein CysA n=1 Tax=Paracidovorax wautersii TaxID=1177982 RepID=A0A7V8FS05_9BURK|nr:MAG: Sulfate/thiosulfate import ATP-binding protein CysA [Paracidovorax wautersii]